MASSGQNFNQTVNIAEPRDAVSQALIAGTAGVPDYTVTTAGTGSILLSRRYTPLAHVRSSTVGCPRPDAAAPAPEENRRS